MFRRPTYGRHWTVADDERLRALAAERRTDNDIAVTLGRSREAVAERRAYLSWKAPA